MKSTFLTTLLSCFVFILYVSTAEAGETGTAEFNYRCLGNGQYHVTVKLPFSAGNIQTATFCRISVTPDQSAVSGFAYHLNRVESEAAFSGDIFALIAPSRNKQIIFSRVLNLGVYKTWQSFTLRYEDNENLLTDCNEMKEINLELNINSLSGICAGSSVKKEIPCLQNNATFDFENGYLLADKTPAIKEKEVIAEVKPLPILSKDYSKNVTKINLRSQGVTTGGVHRIFIVSKLEIMPGTANAHVVAKPAVKETNAVSKVHCLLLYPNPTDGNVQMMIEDSHDKLFSMQVFDISGRKVSEVSNISKNYVIERNLLKAGIYKVMLIGNEGSVYSGTVVWQ